MPNVVITGAAGGIGQALVSHFAASGYDVIATDRVERPNDLLCHSYHVVDLERTIHDERYAEEKYAAIVESLDGTGLEALINNAAIQILGGVDSLNRADWRLTLDVNLLAPFFLVQAMLRELERAKGCVINISSIHARLTKRGFVAYSASKAALSGLTKSMAVDLKGRVRVNAIEPAAISTEMLLAGFDNKVDSLDRLGQFHPLGRIGTPQEVATLACMLARNDIGFCNGSIVSLDGGISSVLHDPN